MRNGAVERGENRIMEEHLQGKAKGAACFFSSHFYIRKRDYQPLAVESSNGCLWHETACKSTFSLLNVLTIVQQK